MIFLQGSVDFGSEALSITGSGVGSTKSRERKERGTIQYYAEPILNFRVTWFMGGKLGRNFVANFSEFVVKNCGYSRYQTVWEQYAACLI